MTRNGRDTGGEEWRDTTLAPGPVRHDDWRALPRQAQVPRRDGQFQVRENNLYFSKDIWDPKKNFAARDLEWKDARAHVTVGPVTETGNGGNAKSPGDGNSKQQ